MDIREQLYDAIKKEIVGPSPNNHYKDPVTGEEILVSSVHGSPKSRYGAGMLYPKQTNNIETTDTGAEPVENIDESENEGQRASEDKYRTQNLSENGSADEEPVSLANQYLPSAMGFTVRFFDNQKDDMIEININSSYYSKTKEKIAKKTIDKNGQIGIVESKGKPYLSEGWVRNPIKIDTLKYNLRSIFSRNKKVYEVIVAKNEEGINLLKFQMVNRSSKRDTEEGYLTYTFTIINELTGSTNDRINSSQILFQNKISLTTNNDKLIAPYPERISPNDTSDEKEMNLLYRNKRIFAIGHGVAVEWPDQSNYVNRIETSVISKYELPQVAPTSFVELSMYELSDLGNWEAGLESMGQMIQEYKSWIDELDIESKTERLSEYKEAALNNIRKCRLSLKRIQRGFDLLGNSSIDSDIVKCFRWANRAMIWQQQRSKIPQRKWIKTGKGQSATLILQDEDSISKKTLLEYSQESMFNGRWRPFQLAFVLMNLESIVNSDSKEREIVDLIWFPTGGGKTEAYLGLSAFTIFFRKLKGSMDWDWVSYGGTSILMRYTLRLLTTQQYERAASLICGCELIRKEHEADLGDEKISIGLWVGGTSSPNTNSGAISHLNMLKADPKEPYQFVVMKCPCCGAQIGKVDGATKHDAKRVVGIKKEDGNQGKVFFTCENSTCEFYQIEIPMTVIDDNIYQNPPTLLLGTVDKFAMVTWKQEAGRIFGFRNDGDKTTRISPPELIIQDELHLIAGPLGTMVGLYETMIQTLCNNYNRKLPPFINEDLSFTPPKIIASSATISRAYEQVKNLYGIQSKEQLSIFPAQGLQFGDTWFSEEKSTLEKNEDGTTVFPGRNYIGILASGYPSAQTAIVRAYSTVLQKLSELKDEEPVTSLDYYWTLLGYFNSIRELGGASSLVYGDIKERLSQIQARELIPFLKRRRLSRIEELTSRRSSSEIPSILKRIEENYRNNKTSAIDVCLATNMVATGVDISRLGLMFIHGQPKTTAEYIQASSRVGRDTRNGPGIIFTLYSPSKPRDKSQYEQFQGYHSRIYSNVEPTSVTPFSINARERGLHAVLIGLVRHFASGSLRKDAKHNVDEFNELISIFKHLIIERCKIVDRLEENNTLQLLDFIINFWEKGFDKYGDAGNLGILKDEGYKPLMYASSAEVRNEIIEFERSLPTPTSMRGVDSESVLQII